MAIDTEKHPLYATWQMMKGRCFNPNNPSFENYGGRGILVCHRWLIFANFEADLSPRPDGATLERKDNNGNYEPDNCTWATKKEQARNQRKTMYVTIEGATYKAIELKDKLGIGVQTIKRRAGAGMSMEEIMSGKKIKHPPFPKHGMEKAWAKKREQTHCKNGHPLSGDNLIMDASRRVCRVCRAVTRAAWRAKRKAAGLPYV